LLHLRDVKVLETEGPGRRAPPERWRIHQQGDAIPVHITCTCRPPAVWKTTNGGTAFPFHRNGVVSPSGAVVARAFQPRESQRGRSYEIPTRAATHSSLLLYNPRMPRYVAFLRAVSPMNASMQELRAAFEAGGFTDVKTVRSSGNVVFTARMASHASLQRKAEAAVLSRLGHTFLTIVRPVNRLRALLASDPYRDADLAPGSKRIVTFLRERPNAGLVLPIEFQGARILAMEDREIFSAYVPSPKGAAFMTLIEKTFGKELTTRTWETVAKTAR